jgi:hypothetical protein
MQMRALSLFAPSAVRLLLFILVCIPSNCFAEKMQGEMSVWDLIWYEGATNYPQRWWHGIGPLAGLFVWVLFFIMLVWYLLRLLRSKR